MSVINEFGQLEELELEDALQRLSTGAVEALDDDITILDVMEWN